MKHREGRFFQGFLMADVLVNAVTLIGTAMIIYTTYQDLSFAGFLALFILALLVPYFFVTDLILFLLLFSAIKEELKLVLVPFFLQSMAPILWLLFASALKNWGWVEVFMALQSVAGIFGILLWFVQRKKSQRDIKRNR